MTTDLARFPLFQKTRFVAKRCVRANTLLDGKFPFTLQGYELRAVPGGGPGKMYYHPQAKRVIIVGEDPIPMVTRGGTDADFLKAAGNKKFTVIQVISGSKDPAGHAATVNGMLGK